MIHVTTADWKTFSEVRLHLKGEMFGAVGVCSPDIVAADGRFVLGFNTWGEPDDRPNQLFCMESADLAAWSAPIAIAPNLTVGHRCIDLALARHGDRWIAVWREGQTPRFGWARELRGPWSFIGDDGSGRIVREDGRVIRDEKMTHENFQFIAIDGTWHLLSTDYNPHEPWLYRMVGDPAELRSWTQWCDGRVLRMPSQGFNSMTGDMDCVRRADFVRPLYPCWDDPSRVHIVDGLSNAPFAWDERARDGHFYVLYAGKNEQRRNDFNGTAAGGGSRGWPRGWNRLAVARSRDLRTWEAAPE